MRFPLLTLLLTIPLAAGAWNARGHMIIASIAYQELSDTQQSRITEILVQHPEYERKWESGYQDINENTELGLYLFMRASVWPDEIRGNNHPQHEYNAPICII